MLQGAIKSDNLQRAHDIVRMVHHTTSLDTALKVAEYYHLIGLQDKIKAWKRICEDRDRLEEERDARRGWAKGVVPIAAPEVLFAGGTSESRATQNTVPKRSLGNAIPSYAKTAFARKSDTTFAKNIQASTSIIPSSSAITNETYDDMSFGQSTFDYSQEEAPSPPSNTKRKRNGDDEDEETGSGGTKKARTESQGTVSTSTPPPSNLPTKPKAAHAAVPVNAKPNPFARNIVTNRSIVKSNTFFEKVDAAEAAGPSRKSKSC